MKHVIEFKEEILSIVRVTKQNSMFFAWFFDLRRGSHPQELFRSYWGPCPTCTSGRNLLHENLIHISLNSTKIHMSGIESLIVQSVFDEAFWRVRSYWFAFVVSVKVPYFGDWIINFMNDSNRNLFITCSNQHFWSFLSECLSNDWWNVFFFEIGRDVEGIEVLEVLSWRVLGAVAKQGESPRDEEPYGPR